MNHLLHNVIKMLNSWWYKYQKTVLVICGLASFYLIFLIFQTAHLNADLQRQANLLETQISQIVTDNQNLDFKLKYYSTEYAKELEARKLNFQKQGETTLIVDKDSQIASINNDFNNTLASQAYPNWRIWWDFIFQN